VREIDWSIACRAEYGRLVRFLALVQQHLRLVLQAGDLVVDLLQRAGSLQHLGVIGRIVDETRQYIRDGCLIGLGRLWFPEFPLNPNKLK
jgi:hypothetical protein